MECKRQSLEKMAHIGIVTSNLHQYLESFKKQFEIEEISTYDFIPTQAYAFGKKIEDCKLKIAMVLLQGGTLIEVIEAVSGDTPHKRFLVEGNDGLHHMAFYTERFEECLKEYANCGGWDIVFKAETEDERGYRRCFYVKDKRINCLYEFVEKPYIRAV